MLDPLSLLSQLLKCWYMDINYLIELCNKNWLDIDIEEIEKQYWEKNPDINTLIYCKIYDVAMIFIEEHSASIEQILNINDIYDYMSYNDIFEIYVNYLDSHLNFSNLEIQKLFDRSSYSV